MKKQVKRKHIPCFNIFGNIYLCCDFFLFLNVCSHAMTKTSLFINNNRYSYLFSKRLCVYHRFYLVGLKVCKNYIEIHYTCTVLHNFWLIFNNLLNMQRLRKISTWNQQHVIYINSKDHTCLLLQSGTSFC